MSSNSHVLSLVLSQQIRLPTQHVQDSVNHQFLYFLFPLLHGFHFLLHVLTPAICSTTGFRYLSCVESLCVQMCAWTSRFLRNLKGPIPEDPLNPGNECQGLGRWVVSGPSWSLLPPQSAIPANALMWEGISLGRVGGVGGGWRGGGHLEWEQQPSAMEAGGHAPLQLSGFLQNIFLYIFREQKISAAIRFKIFILNTFQKQITPKEAF